MTKYHGSFDNHDSMKSAFEGYDGKPVDGMFEGWAEENTGWGNGPFNDWLLASNRLVQVAYDTAVPTVQVGPIAIPAQV